MDAEHEEAGRDLLLVALRLRRGWQEVAGDLLANELVVRLVAVERVDHVIAITPGVRIGDIARWAGRFGIAGDVEPVPAPALAERRRSEEAIDQLLVADASCVGHECVDLGGRRRQAGEVEGQPADQRHAIGIAHRS